MSQKGTEVGQSHGVERSSHWPAVEHNHLKTSPACIVCGKTDADNVGRQIHHIFPYHYCMLLGRPDLELTDANLVTLCEDEKGDQPCDDDHIDLGHLGDFKSANLHIREDAGAFKGMTKDEILADPRYLARKASRLKLWPEMTDQDKTDFKALMDATYPLPEGVTPEIALQSIIDGLKKGG